MKPLFENAVVYGVGLLGGSLGMAMKAGGLARNVIGLGRSPERLERARELGAIDEYSTEESESLQRADALFLCLPPRLIRGRLESIAAHLPPRAFVTDVASVKQNIVQAAEEAFGPDRLYVGSHPMAGSEQAGVEASRSTLFEGSGCLVTPTARTPLNAVAIAVNFWRSIGSRVVVMNPERHDELLARVSHLPHLAAGALVNGLYAEGDSTLMMKTILGNGFRDATRIAAAEPGMWTDIALENRGALERSIDDHIEMMQEWKRSIQDPENEASIRENFESTRARRRDLDS